MVRTWLGLLGVFLVTAANAATSPSSPFTAVNNDGRPMTGATVTIVDELGMPAVAWADAQGTQAYSKVVPSTGIVQFFADPKTYIVTVSGSGVTRQFYIDLTGGGGTGEGGGGGGLTEADFGPGDGLLRKLGSDSFGLVKFVSDGLGAPGSSQDSQRGYSVGSFWVDTLANKAYQCVSANPGAAIWKQISNEVGSSGGGGNIGPGTTPSQVPFWTGVQWLPSSGLWSDGAVAGVGDQGLADTHSTFQISRNSLAPIMFLWIAKPAILAGNILGEIDFGATGPSSAPRRSASIVARATDTWGPDYNTSPTSLDFRVQDESSADRLSSNPLRIVGTKVKAGSAIPDANTIGSPVGLATISLDIYDGTGSQAITLQTPAGLVAPLGLVLPNNTGTSGFALTTDGGSPTAQLRWSAVTPGLHAANHAQGGIDEVASYQKIWDEGTLLTQRRELAFVGAGVTCADTGGKTTCTVANSGGGSGVTSINSDTSAAQTLTVGSTGIDFGIVNNLTGGHVFNIPNASASARGFMDTTPQSFAGTKTFIDPFIASVGATFNNNGEAVNFVVKSDTSNQAIFVDGAGNSVGIMTSQPNQIFAPGTSLGVAGLIGKNGITVQASADHDGLVAFSNGTGAAVHGYGIGSGGSGIFGESTLAGAMAGRFERNLVSTVPIVQIKQNNASDTQPLLSLVSGNGTYQLAGYGSGGGGVPNWGISSSGQFISSWVFGEVEPMIESAFSPGTGFYIDSTFPGLSTLGTSGFHLEDMGGALQPRAAFTVSDFKVNSAALPTAGSYLATFKHSGAGNGVFIDNIAAGASAIGLKVQGGNDILSTTAGRFDINMGTAVDARQTGAAASSSTAPTLRVTRETTLTGGAAFSGAVAQIVDGSGSGSTGRLIDIQKPSNVSKFFINGDGSTTIDNSTGVASSALTVKGANAAGSAKGALFTAGTGNIVDIKQTGVAAAGSFDPVFRVTKDMTFTAGNLSSGAVILGIDGTTGTAGVGRLIDLQKPEGTSKFFVNGDGSTNIDTSLTPGVTGLTVKGSNAQGDAKAALFTSVAGNTVLIKQTGASAAGVSSFDPTLSVVKDMTFTGGNLSTGALIQGVDATGVTGLGYLFQLQQPLGTDRFLVTRTGELNFAGVAADGAGKVLCVKPAGGDIGTCTSAVSAAGVCTCA